MSDRDIVIIAGCGCATPEYRVCDNCLCCKDCCDCYHCDGCGKATDDTYDCYPHGDLCEDCAYEVTK